MNTSRQQKKIFIGTFDDVMKYNTAWRKYMRLLPISGGHIIVSYMNDSLYV